MDAQHGFYKSHAISNDQRCFEWRPLLDLDYHVTLLLKITAHVIVARMHGLHDRAGITSIEKRPVITIIDASKDVAKAGLQQPLKARAFGIEKDNKRSQWTCTPTCSRRASSAASGPFALMYWSHFS